MFAYVLIAVEATVLLLAIWHVFRSNSPEYRVNKDIWGLYEGASKPAKQGEMHVLVFHRHSSSAALMTSTKCAK